MSSWILATTGLCAVNMSKVEAVEVLYSGGDVWKLEAYCNGLNYTLGLYANREEAMKAMYSTISILREAKV